jgi:hypothetical protein
LGSNLGHLINQDEPAKEQLAPGKQRITGHRVGRNWLA